MQAPDTECGLKSKHGTRLLCVVQHSSMQPKIWFGTRIKSIRPDHFLCSATEVEKLTLRPERSSLHVERFREDGVAMASNGGGGFAAQAGLRLGTSIRHHGEFRSLRSS